MEIRPCELRDANTFIERLHRHHKRVVGHRFSISAWHESRMVGVAVLGRPVARMTDQANVLEVTRLCTDGTRNACSALYSAAARAARAIGYEKIQTFILDSESGVSLKASGWKRGPDSAGGAWSRPSRGRQDKAPLDKKVRWELVLKSEKRGAE